MSKLQEKFGRMHTATISKIEDEYDAARIAGELTVDQEAQYTFRMISQNDLYAEQMEAIRLAQVIAPAFAGQLMAGLRNAQEAR